MRGSIHLSPSVALPSNQSLPFYPRLKYRPVLIIDQFHPDTDMNERRRRLHDQLPTLELFEPTLEDIFPEEVLGAANWKEPVFPGDAIFPACQCPKGCEDSGGMSDVWMLNQVSAWLALALIVMSRAACRAGTSLEFRRTRRAQPQTAISSMAAPFIPFSSS